MTNLEERLQIDQHQFQHGLHDVQTYQANPNLEEGGKSSFQINTFLFSIQHSCSLIVHLIHLQAPKGRAAIVVYISCLQPHLAHAQSQTTTIKPLRGKKEKGL